MRRWAVVSNILRRGGAVCLAALTLWAAAVTAGSGTLRLLPPLVITKEEMDRGLAIMAQVMG